MGRKDELIKKEFENWSNPRCISHNGRAKAKMLLLRSYRKLLISNCKAKKGDKIIDLGSGLGDLVFDLEQKYPGKLELVGVDITRPLIRQSQKRAKKFKNKNIKFVQAAIDKMEFKENTFDYAFCMRSLHHFYRPVTMLRRVRHILKNCGKIVIFDWCRDFREVEQWDIHYKKIKKSHYKFFTLDEIKNLLKGAGFKRISGHKKDNYMIVTARKHFSG